MNAIAYIVTVLLTIAVVAYVRWMVRFDRDNRRERAEREARWLRDDEELRSMRCAIWKQLGESEHRSGCLRCMGHSERPQA